MKTMIKKLLATLFFSVGAAISVHSAHAQGIPVYDNLGYLNSLQQLTNTISQLKTQYEQLNQAKQQLQSMTGGRGMENMLPNVQRNYLPVNWDQALGMATQSQSQYSAIAQKIQEITGKNAVLTASDMAKLPPETQARILRMRNAVATENAMSQAAYQNASNNVSNIQSLISAIGTAPDLKAVADLSARIQAEQAMIQNDANKLAQAAQLHASEQRLIQQQLSEASAAMMTAKEPTISFAP